MESPISELERFTRLRTRSGDTDAKMVLAPQYLRKLRKGLNLSYFGQKNREKRAVSKLLGQKNLEEKTSNFFVLHSEYRMRVARA